MIEPLNEKEYDELKYKSLEAEEAVNGFRACFEILLDAIPATFGLLFVFVAETINIIFIGRYNDTEMISAIGIGTLYVNATGYIIGAGLVGGIDTLCSQTFGAKKYKLMGIYANICRIIIVLCFIVITVPLVIYTGELLLMIGQDTRVATIASSFAHSMLPSIFLAIQYQASLRYLQAMNIFTPGMIITMITAILHSLWCFVFINVLDLNVIGAGIAMAITQLLNNILIGIYINYKNPCPESYFFINADCFDMILICNYLRKALPAAILFAADWLGFEILTLMSSYLSSLALAANVCLFNFITLIFMIPMGLSFATTTLVGNSIGAMKVERAKKYSIIAVLTGVSIIGVITLLVIIFKNEIPYVYTSDPAIASSVTALLNIYVCFSILDCIQIITHGVIKGLGKQKIASIIALIVLYPINIPMAYYLGFVLGYGLLGLWYSQLISIILLAVSYLSIVFILDWNIVAKQVQFLFSKDDLHIQKKLSTSN